MTTIRVIYSARCKLDNIHYYFVVDRHRVAEEIKAEIADKARWVMEFSNESGENYIYRALNISNIKINDTTGVCDINYCEAYGYAIITIEHPLMFLERTDAILEDAISGLFSPLPDADETLEFLS